MRFEWDINKAKANIKNHGVTFKEAEDAFFDEFALDIYDGDHSDLNEERFKLLGLTSKGVLLVVYTLRQGDLFKIISARRATKSEESSYWIERRKYE